MRGFTVRLGFRAGVDVDDSFRGRKNKAVWRDGDVLMSEFQRWQTRCERRRVVVSRFRRNGSSTSGMRNIWCGESIVSAWRCSIVGGFVYLANREMFIQV